MPREIEAKWGAQGKDESYKGTLKGRVVEGINLITNKGGSLYVIVRLGKAFFETKSIKGTTNPKWDEFFCLVVSIVETIFTT